LEVEAEFEKKFGIPVPWWWICSVEERARRLEETNKADGMKMYGFAAKDRESYRKGKIIAEYEMWFKRPFPDGERCGDDYRIRQAEEALDAGLPYLSEAEYAELKTKMKTEYKKMFKVSMPDYWLSVARVYHTWKPNAYASTYHVLVTRLPSGGAVARLVREGMYGYSLYSLEIGIRDWLRFINELNYAGVNGWEIKRPDRYYGNSESYGNYWNGDLKIFTLDSDRYAPDLYGRCAGNIRIREFKSGVHVLPPDWKKFQTVIKDMMARIEKEEERSQRY
jgi:hypothetical protein